MTPESLPSRSSVAREVAGNIPRDVFERAVEASAKAICGHRSYRMVAAEVLASVDFAGAVEALRRASVRSDYDGNPTTTHGWVQVSFRPEDWATLERLTGGSDA